MNPAKMPKDCDKQWDILLLLISSEEKKIDRTQNSEIDTMNYFGSNIGIRTIFRQWLEQMKASYAKKLSESDTSLKCDEISLLWRQRGNEKFRCNEIEKSYDCYTKSVIYAHKEGSMYPLALANRSAALHKMKKFKECLADITLALDYGYPLEQQHKLLLRQADCYIELGNECDARKSLSDAGRHGEKLKLTPSHSAELEKHIKTLNKKLGLMEQSDNATSEVILPECCMGRNQDFVSAANVVELRRCISVGRYVVASQTTKRGDVLFSEEPYACVALPSDDNPVCDECCDTEINAVPCNVCSRTLYCSEACRVAAWSYHKWECVGAASKLFPTIGIAHLALRVLLITARDGFPKVPNDSNPTTARELFSCYSEIDNVTIYKEGYPPFYRMFNLVTNIKEMNSMDLIQYALTAVMLTNYLEDFTNFFAEFGSRLPYKLSDADLRLFAASLMLRSMAQLVCNGHATLSLTTVVENYDSDNCSGRTISEQEVRRATAIYPSAAMMNHSCDPNIINTFYKRRLLVRSGQEIVAGSQVYNCYGPHRARLSTNSRRAILRAQYMFHCVCNSCTDSANNQLQLFSAYLCQNCKGAVPTGRPQCQQCNTPLPQNLAATLDDANELMAQADRVPDTSVRCDMVQAALKLRQQVLHRHHADLRAAADELARIYADIGDFSKSIELIKQNIPSLEYQYGSFSVEVAHELRKLSDVMLERIIHYPQHSEYRNWCLETHKIIKKAIQLMDLNYGPWQGVVCRLRKKESVVATFLAKSGTTDTADSIHNSLHYNLKI